MSGSSTLESSTSESSEMSWNSRRIGGASLSAGSESAVEGGIERDWEELSTESVSASRLTVLFPTGPWDQLLQPTGWCRLKSGDLSGHSCGNPDVEEDFVSS